jgi:hypothetical protein
VGVNDIRARFGERVGAIVAAVTEDPALPDYRARKGALRAAVADAGSDAHARLRRRQGGQGPASCTPKRRAPRGCWTSPGCADGSRPTSTASGCSGPRHPAWRSSSSSPSSSVRCAHRRRGGKPPGHPERPPRRNLRLRARARWF